MTAHSGGEDTAPRSVLTVALPPALAHVSARELVQEVERRLTPAVLRVRLDASAVTHVDMAGLGALARVVRMTLDVVGRRPELVHASSELRSSMRSVLLLGMFEVAEDEAG